MDIKEHLTNINFARATNRKIKYIVVHYTANDGDTDEGNAKYFHSTHRSASAHYFVDEDSITRVVLDKDVAWHCGDTQKYTNGGASLKAIVTNQNSIGIEMCSDILNGEYVITEKTVENTVWLINKLMKEYNIPFENVVRHYDVTGKLCPRPYVDNLKWYKFKDKILSMDEKVSREMDEKIYNELTEFNSEYQEALKWCMEKGILKGNGKGLGLTKSEAKCLVFLYRAMNLK